LAGKTLPFRFLPFSPHLERPGDEQVYKTNKESVKKPMGTKSFVHIEINAVFMLPVKCNFVQVYSTTLTQREKSHWQNGSANARGRRRKE
jgi:hypothetical protein